MAATFIRSYIVSDALTVVWSEAVTDTDAAGHSISASGGASALTYSSGSGTASVVYSLSRVPASSEVVTYSYDSGTGNATDSSGSVASVSGESVGFPATLTTATAAPGAQTITLTYSEALTYTP